MADVSPAFIEVAPGKHTVTVQGHGVGVFLPAEYPVDLAPDDTQRLVFMSQRAAQYRQQQQQQKRANGAGGSTVAAPLAANATAPTATATSPDLSKMTTAPRRSYLQSLRRKTPSTSGTP